MSSVTRRSALLGLGAIAMSALIAPQANAQQWPERPIRLIVGFTPGGSTDIAARVLADELTKSLGQTVIVENKPGASGNIASAFVAQAEPDGYTLMLCTITTHTINPHLYPNLNFHPLKDFKAVSLVARLPNIITVNPSFPAQTLQEFVEMAKAEPGKYQYATISGSSPHLTAEVFQERAGISMQLIPYKGSIPGITAVASGQPPISVDNLAPAMAFLQSGRIRALAVTGPQRIAGLENVPTVAESGYPGFAVEGWNGVVAPAGTPDAIVNRLNQEITKILATSEVKSKLDQLNVRVEASTPEEFTKLIHDEFDSWAGVIKRVGLTAP